MVDKTIPRPISVTLLAIFLFLVAIWNGLRLFESLNYWKILISHNAMPGPFYLAITGGIWLIVVLIITWGLWQGKTWSRFAVLLASLVFWAWYWFDRLMLQVPHANWPFELTVTFLALFFIFSILFSRNARNFLRQRGRHEQEKSKSTD